VYVSPVADSVSQTRRVRVEIDNPEGWPAGTQARVRFTEPTGEWKSRVPAGGSATPGGGVSAAEPAAGTAVARTEGPAK
jgi:multidrug efflux pump subunit AcrA (membrane-fusion protein)